MGYLNDEMREIVCILYVDSVGIVLIRYRAECCIQVSLYPHTGKIILSLRASSRSVPIRKTNPMPIGLGEQ